MAQTSLPPLVDSLDVLVKSYDVSSKDQSPGRKAMFDIYTLRQWFMEMDTEQSGHVTKDAFMLFLRQRPQLRNLMLAQSQQQVGKNAKEALMTKQAAHALEMRRMLKVLRDIDEDKNGTLEWEEFIEFFRKSGYLLEYSRENPHNPREKLAHIMGQIHDQKLEREDIDNKLVGNLAELAGKHLNVHARRRSRELVDSEDVPVKLLTSGRRASASNILDSVLHSRSAAKDSATQELSRRKSIF